MKRVEMFVQAISEAIAAMSVHINRYFQSLLNVVREQTGDRQGDIAPMLRLDAKQRDRRSFDDVRTAWTTLAEFFEVIAAAMSRLTTALGKLSQYNVPNHDDFVSSAQAAARHLEELNALLRQFTLEPDTNTVYWAHIGQSDGRSDNLVIHAAPLHVGILTAQHLWHTKESVILTSATLRTQDNFDYIRERLSAEDAQGLEVGSPFDFRQSTLIYLPTDIPEPTDKQGYQRAVERGIIELASALNGRVLVLFTSYAQLRQTAQAIAPRLALGSIAVYDQSDGGSRQSLVEGFKTNEKAVLMGTRSFWEGIDIPGESLSALVIVRLPFAVPTDPVFAARSETYSDAFNDYAVPDAILRFRQGFGRLIRTRTDRGVVTVFDSRVITKKYGENFLAALPECTHQRGPLEGLAGAAKAWINPVGDSSSL
jgi:DNA polymerase-3 subunit epsilon/ATP-dependent DNA helicase DinG